MGISRNNGEGYPDPTAHIAVRNVEADAKKTENQLSDWVHRTELGAFLPLPTVKGEEGVPAHPSLLHPDG